MTLNRFLQSEIKKIMGNLGFMNCFTSAVSFAVSLYTNPSSASARSYAIEFDQNFGLRSQIYLPIPWAPRQLNSFHSDNSTKSNIILYPGGGGGVTIQGNLAL